MELDPQYREARLQFAYLLMGRQNYQGALSQFARITRVEPKEAFQFFYSIAYANYRIGRKEAAQESAKRALEHADSEGHRATVTQLMSAMIDRPSAVWKEEPPEEEGGTAPSTPYTPSPMRIHRPRAKTLAGTLEHLECLDEVARLRVRTSAGTIRLLMEDPEDIEIRGTDTGKFTFQCGAQKPRDVSIEYEPRVDEKLGTIGVVKMIEFE